MRKFFLRVFLIFIFLFLVFGKNNVLAKKSLLKKKTTTGSQTVVISARLRSDRLALIVNFANLNLAKSVSYALTYNTDGRPEAVQGTIIPKANTEEERVLVFGTYSSGAWRFHTNITDMKLVVTTNLKTGKKLIKTFRVRP